MTPGVLLRAALMGNGVGVPPFGQHGDRDYAAHLFAKPSFLADCVHDLAQKVGVGNVPDFARIITLGDLTLELLDLERGGTTKVIIQRFPGLKLLAAD
jgi:hypothetical protein